MVKNSVNRLAKTIAKFSNRLQRRRPVLCGAGAGQHLPANMSAGRRFQISAVPLSSGSVSAGSAKSLSRDRTQFSRLRSRSILDLALVALVLVSTTTVVSSQSANPCPPSDPDSGNATENLIKGTMRYHEWALEVLEEVTASVSGRMQSPEGADSNSITVFMDVVAGGEIDQLAVEQGSGSSAFDDEFLQAIQSLAPFSIDTEYMQECSLPRLALSIKWLNGGSLTEIRSQN